MARLIWPSCRLAYESSKKQNWNTTSKRTGGGRYKSTTSQHYPQYTIKAAIKRMTDAEAREIEGFVAQLKGAHTPFYWLDPEDFQETKTRLPMVSAGLYQPVMMMGGYAIPVSYVDKLTVYVDGVEQKPADYSLTGAGYIRFKTAPAAWAIVTATYRYYWEVVLTTDGIEIDHVFDDFNRSAQFEMETVG